MAQLRTRTGRPAPAAIAGAALELFLTRGLAAVSLGDIAERVGVTKAAVYHHYKTRDALVLEVFRPLLEELARLDEDSVHDHVLVDRVIDLAVAHRELVLLAQPHLLDGLGPAALQHLAAASETLLTAMAPQGTPEQRVRALVVLTGICAVLRDLDTTPAAVAELRRVARLVVHDRSPAHGER
jgi:AcrR family transcriptional regulator